MCHQQSNPPRLIALKEDLRRRLLMGQNGGGQACKSKRQRHKLGVSHAVIGQSDILEGKWGILHRGPTLGVWYLHIQM